MSSNMKKELWDWMRSIGLAVILALLFRLFLFEVFMVDGDSMFPTLQDRERLIVNKFIYRFEEPGPGDIVVFTQSPQRDWVKRVIGREGDIIEVSGGVLYCNGRPVEETYLTEQMYMDYGPVEVPPGNVFLMGDNRNKSMDSRDPNVGFISLERIKGKAFFVYWPPLSMRVLREEG